jgi:Transketolase, thiamine diphosphate binding domain
MALAPVACCLWQRFLRFDPTHPIWPNRDRFVLSAGHASVLLYAMLHLTGVCAVNPKYETLGQLSVTLEDIKRRTTAAVVLDPDRMLVTGVFGVLALMGTLIGARTASRARPDVAPRLRSACSRRRRVHGSRCSRLSVADARCGCHRDREIVANAAGHAGSSYLNPFGGARRSTTAVTSPASCVPARFISAFYDTWFGRHHRAASAMMSVSVASTSFATAWRPGVP